MGRSAGPGRSAPRRNPRDARRSTRSSSERAVELRQGKIRARLAQDLVGLTQLAVLALQRLQLLGDFDRHAGTLAAVDLRLLHPLVQRLRRTADLLRDRHNRRPARGMLSGAIQYQPDRPLANLR